MAGQRFIANYREQRREIDLEPGGEGKYIVTIDGVRHEVDARRFSGGSSSVLIDGQSYDVELEVAGNRPESEGAYNTLVRGRLVSLTVQDERRIRMAAGTKRLKLDGPQVLSSPMPGKVVKILVEVGQDVAEGQPLIIVEAMKMENELRSPTAGKIASVMVKEGQAIEANARLIAVE